MLWGILAFLSIRLIFISSCTAGSHIVVILKWEYYKQERLSSCGTSRSENYLETKSSKYCQPIIVKFSPRVDRLSWQLQNVHLVVADAEHDKVSHSLLKVAETNLWPGREARPPFSFVQRSWWSRWTEWSACQRKRPSRPSFTFSSQSDLMWCWWVWTRTLWVCSSKSWKQKTSPSFGALLQAIHGGRGSWNTQTWNTSKKPLNNPLPSSQTNSLPPLKGPRVWVGDILWQEIPSLPTSSFGHLLSSGRHDKVPIEQQFQPFFVQCVLFQEIVSERLPQNEVLTHLWENLSRKLPSGRMLGRNWRKERKSWGEALRCWKSSTASGLLFPYLS